MSFLPIAERELRVASRRNTTFRLRLCLVLGALVVWFCILATQGGQVPTDSRAKLLFHSLGVLALAFTVFAGAFLTADCLSEERRQGTLGLLFLTDLHGFDVVAGKLLATSLHSIYGLLAICPLLALPILMGGVTLGDFTRLAVVLIVTLYVSLAIGMAVSSFAHDSRQAMTTTLLVVLLLTLVLPACWWLVRLSSTKPHFDALLWPSPAYFYGRAPDAIYRLPNGKTEFFICLIGQIAIGTTGLAVASYRLPRTWQTGSPEATGPRAPDQGWRFGSSPFRTFRRLRLEDNPFYWRASRDRRPRLVAWFAMGLLVLIWFIFLSLTFNTSGFNSGAAFSTCLVFAFVIHALFKLLVAMEATRRLYEDKATGALELLLVTPLPVDAIFRGQIRAVLETFIGPACILMTMNSALLIRIFAGKGLDFDAQGTIAFCEMLAGGSIALAMDFFALARVGMTCALKARKPYRAILGCLARVLLPPWIGIALFFLLSTGSGISADAIVFLIGLYFVLTLFLDGGWMNRARSEFRQIRAN